MNVFGSEAEITHASKYSHNNLKCTLTTTWMQKAKQNNLLSTYNMNISQHKNLMTQHNYKQYQSMTGSHFKITFT